VARSLANAFGLLAIGKLLLHLPADFVSGSFTRSYAALVKYFLGIVAILSVLCREIPAVVNFFLEFAVMD